MKLESRVRRFTVTEKVSAPSGLDRTISVRILYLCIFGTFPAFVLIPSPSVAATPLPDILAIDYGGKVTRWNIEANAPVFSVSTGTSVINDMTKTRDGRFLAYRGLRSDANPSLLQINPNTGASTLLVSSPNASPALFALTARDNGKLFGFGYHEIIPGTSEYLYKFLDINPITLNYQIVNISNTFTTPTGALFIPEGMSTAPDGTVYGWGSGGDIEGGITSRLFRVDFASNMAISIGGIHNLPSGISFIDLAFTPDGRLFGFTEGSAGLNGAPVLPNSIYEIDLQTGLPTFVSQPGAIFAGLRGVEFFSIPEPPTFGLVAIGACPLILRRRARPVAPLL